MTRQMYGTNVELTNVLYNYFRTIIVTMLQTREDIDQIRFLKAARGLDSRRIQEDISEKTDVSKGNVSEYLNLIKVPSENFLQKFYNSFGINPESLIITDEDVQFREFVRSNKFKDKGKFKYIEAKDGIGKKGGGVNLGLQGLSPELALQEIAKALKEQGEALRRIESKINVASPASKGTKRVSEAVRRRKGKTT